VAADVPYFGFTLALAIVEAVLAYACWTMKKWGFLASTFSAIVVAGLGFGILYSPIGDLLLLLQLQVVLFAYRAHREAKQKPRNLSTLYVLIPVLAVLTTLATGLWARPGDGGSEYGFPLPWKTEEIIPTCHMCPQPTSYNWAFFILDTAFYAAVGYGIVFLYTRIVWKQQHHLVDPGKAAKPQASLQPS
jgi:hypothetical protein